MKLFRMLVLFSLFPCPFGSGEAQDKVVVATLRSVSQWSFWMALESGFYKEYGLDVVPVTFTGGTQTITSLVSGDVQITTTGGSTAINAAIKGGDVTLISTTLGIFPYTFYVSSRIRGPEDLKGKKIGILSFGGTAYPLRGMLSLSSVSIQTRTLPLYKRGTRLRDSARWSAVASRVRCFSLPIRSRQKS